MTRIALIFKIVVATAFCAVAAQPLPQGGPYRETVGNAEWTFRVDANLNAIVGTVTAEGAVAIPSALGGRRVTRIDDNAFKMRSDLTHVSIPESVTNIGMHAFWWCEGLKTVTIPKSVSHIGPYAFAACSGLTNVTISAGVTHIDGHAFYGCNGLPRVTIPSSVRNIGQDAFSRCENLVAMDVAAENEHYSSQDGVLFDKTKKRLIYFPSGRTGTYVIPSGVERIADKAFYECIGLTSVTIPPSVTDIGDRALAVGGGNLSPIGDIRVSPGDTERVKKMLRKSNHTVSGTTFTQSPAPETQKPPTDN